MFQWFWGSVLLWLAVSLWGARLLPGIWGMTHIGPLFLPHAYLTVASVFFWIDFKQAAARETGQGRLFGLLALFALSNVLMTAAFAFIGGMVWYHYPSPLTLVAAPAMLEFYALRPLNWFVLQTVLMAVLYVHNRMIMRRPVYAFSAAQVQGCLFLALLMQLAALPVLMLAGRV
ncbi:hypothetical protein ACM67C_09685 [Bergeriella denitrificans]|nr:hypothetical protein [Bergeriella denitrificans]